MPEEILGGTLRRARTDEQGRIVLYPLRPGKWRVSVMPPRDAWTNNNRPLNFMPQEAQVPAQGGSLTLRATK